MCLEAHAAQVFDETTGEPKPLAINAVSPIDANDLRQVFWLRSNVNANNQETFEPIKIMGDIDPAFFNATDAGNLARTIIHSVFGDTERNLETALTEGMREIRGRQGGVGWEVVQTITGGAFLSALQTLAATLSTLFGGAANPFLNPTNGLRPNFAAASAEQTLYESVFMPQGGVPLAAQGGGGGGGGGEGGVQARIGSRAVLSEAADRIAEILRPVPASGNNLGINVTTYAPIRAVFDAPASLTSTKLNQVLDYVHQNPQVAVRGNPAAVKAWVDQMRKALAVPAAAAPVSAPIQSPTTVVMRRDSPQWDAMIQRGYRPLPGFTASPGDGFWANTPIAQSLAAQAKARKSVSGRGLSSLYDDYEDDAEVIGTLFEGGQTGKEQVAAVQAHTAYRSEMPGSLEDLQVRWGTLAYNLEEVNKSSLGLLERAIAMAYYLAPWNRQTLEGLLTRNVMPNFGMLGFRIALYDMALGIKVWFVCFVLHPRSRTRAAQCKAGTETAITYYGNSRFMLSDDATIMMHYGNFTHYGKSIVHRPENVFVAYDIFPNRCLGGMGVR
jgi:hypothetical protein